ncbi:EF hand [Poseidonocella pacifica]|uniref:EF hand n=1 Tax=Poseidonocella pacifica TaxID=871651 RepID=A0A1I0VAW5_9RHOB|nr:hypothetical protein [Poseidonocella pacifica]SFA73534.1 EF hand [Poseidonocella pacifica]
MSHALFPALALAILAGAAFALDNAAAALDRNADGYVSFGELLSDHPDLTVETFAALDTDQDGLLGEDEVTAARTTGLWPSDPRG